MRFHSLDRLAEQIDEASSALYESSGPLAKEAIFASHGLLSETASEERCRQIKESVERALRLLDEIEDEIIILSGSTEERLS
jgi:hypothetical protein